MYNCSIEWKADWIPEESAEKVLKNLAKTVQESPHGPEMIGINHGLHFTGGEPFLNFELSLKLIQIAQKFNIPRHLWRQIVSGVSMMKPQGKRLSS